MQISVINIYKCTQKVLIIKIFFLILKEVEKEEKRVNRRIEKKQKRFDSKQKGKKGPEKKDKSSQKITGGESEKEENKKRKVGVRAWKD